MYGVETGRVIDSSYKNEPGSPILYNWWYPRLRSRLGRVQTSGLVSYSAVINVGCS